MFSNNVGMIDGIGPCLVSTCKAGPLFVSLVVTVHDSCLAIPLYNPTKSSVLTICEPGHEKIYLLVLQPGPTQTRLYGHRFWRSLKFRIQKVEGL